MIIDGKMSGGLLKIRLGKIIINLDENGSKKFFRSVWKCGGYYVYRIGNQFSIYVDDKCLLKAMEEFLGYKIPHDYN